MILHGNQKGFLLSLVYKRRVYLHIQGMKRALDWRKPAKRKHLFFFFLKTNLLKEWRNSKEKRLKMNRKMMTLDILRVLGHDKIILFLATKHLFLTYHIRPFFNEISVWRFFCVTRKTFTSKHFGNFLNVQLCNVTATLQPHKIIKTNFNVRNL